MPLPHPTPPPIPTEAPIRASPILHVEQLNLPIVTLPSNPSMIVPVSKTQKYVIYFVT